MIYRIHFLWKSNFCISLSCLCQIGDLKGLFGLLMVNMQSLRAKLKVLDTSYGYGTGRLLILQQKNLRQFKIYVFPCFHCASFKYETEQKLRFSDSLSGNTALVYHHGKLLALSEADKPCMLILSLVLTFEYLWKLIRPVIDIQKAGLVPFHIPFI